MLQRTVHFLLHCSFLNFTQNVGWSYTTFLNLKYCNKFLENLHCQIKPIKCWVDKKSFIVHWVFGRLWIPGRFCGQWLHTWTIVFLSDRYDLPLCIPCLAVRTCYHQYCLCSQSLSGPVAIMTMICHCLHLTGAYLGCSIQSTSIV